MKRIPPEIDQLMWDIAEQANSQALDQFETRYPEYKLEMAQRIAMVRGLRGSTRRPVERPRFQPRPAPAPTWSSPRMVAIAATLVLAAIGVASFTIGTLLRPATKTTVVGVDPGPKVVPFEPKPKENPAPKEPEPSTPEVTQTPPVQVPAYLKPTDLTLRKADLAIALKSIAAAGGLRLEIAPGLPQIDVVVDYRGLTPIQMLQELGRTYAFTAFEQEPGTVLIVPAVDETNPPAPTPMPPTETPTSGGTANEGPARAPTNKGE